MSQEQSEGKAIMLTKASLLTVSAVTVLLVGVSTAAAEEGSGGSNPVPMPLPTQLVDGVPTCC